LQFAVGQLAWTRLVAGELATSARLIEEDQLIAKATGNPPVGYPAMVLGAWRGHEAEASELIERTRNEAASGGVGRVVTYASYASAVLYNGLGRHDEAREAAWRAFEHDPAGIGPLVVVELAEAAARTRDATLMNAVLDWLTERVRVTPTSWALGIEARVRALLSEAEAADRFYQASLMHLDESGVRLELARAHLLYGEWLRRERRRVDARQHLRTAHEMLMTMGVDAFAQRAERELLATGETARKRTVETRDDLTAQEAQIARLARDGLSNPEIGTRLFITPRTVKYHLSKVFAKLDITSRGQLDRVLPGEPAAAGRV
jgi:ATP/maltotriose-dependent transcriptional regulator MalT